MAEWVRNTLISIGSLIVGGVLAQALAFWRDDRQRRREEETKRRARVVSAVQELTETLAPGQKNERKRAARGISDDRDLRRPALDKTAVCRFGIDDRCWEGALGGQSVV